MRFARTLALGALTALVGVHLVFFAIRAWHVLTFPYPLDYGEGPLLAQVNHLRSGASLPHLYGDPAQPPYLVVNYPPVYLIVTSLVAPLLDWTLPGSATTPLAGRLVTLCATLICVLLIWRLTLPPDPSIRRATAGQSGTALIVALAFLALPIVREWSALMRVDLLGVCLGLWGLLLTRRLSRLAAILIALSLLVKPSLIAAPAAALVWLWFRDRRRALEVAAGMVALGGAAAGALQVASGGWFWLHVVSANANPWSPALAEGFWRDQAAILGSLWLGAVFAAALILMRGARRKTRQSNVPPPPAETVYALLPIVYTCFGAYVAFGVGKVGAYANYFLEFYAGAIWLIATVIAQLLDTDRPRSDAQHYSAQPPEFHEQPVEAQSPALASRISMMISWFKTLNARPPVATSLPVRAFQPGLEIWFSLLILLLLVAALIRYYPLWSENHVKPYGLIEGDNPPRFAFGRYGIWRDLQREEEILTTLRRVNTVLVADVRTVGQPIVTDIPGIAAQAGVLSRLQAFEHRQLYDAGLLDQRPLLRDMANGRVPLVVLDYLGNWLTPDMITLITHRYAQEGSRGTFDLYRPVDPGQRSDVRIEIGADIRITAVFLTRPGGTRYDPGERIALTLELNRNRDVAGVCDVVVCQVQVRLVTRDGAPVAAWERPLVYGALRPSDWNDAAIQHMHTLDLPLDLPPGMYHLAVALRANDDMLTPSHPVALIEVGESGGRVLGERGYFVPAPLFAVWMDAGGYEGPGDPLMPAVPFADGVLQCFTRVCFRVTGNEITRLPLGELALIGESGLRPAPPEPGPVRSFPETGYALRGAFLEAWEIYGGMAALGPPISDEMLRGATRVQYTRYARLERLDGETTVLLANLGEEHLRLPGIPYRWR
ncbi:hypothetical protein RoseRS_1411 [Roseiflexus sp. RS-1]|nr:hypothetical protein RoseRS_1411 [Roseiflexus sp. RS-1]